MGHARALLGLEVAAAMEKLARKIVASELSVRRVEELVRRSRDGSKTPQPAASAPRTPSASARDLAMRLTRTLGTRVEVLEVGKERGQIAIHYHSLDQLDALLERLMHS
jgi:ParB family chromosome partitioning protein